MLCWLMTGRPPMDARRIRARAPPAARTPVPPRQRRRDRLTTTPPRTRLVGSHTRRVRHRRKRSGRLRPVHDYNRCSRPCTAGARWFGRYGRANRPRPRQMRRPAPASPATAGWPAAPTSRTTVRHAARQPCRRRRAHFGRPRRTPFPSPTARPSSIRAVRIERRPDRSVRLTPGPAPANATVARHRAKTRAAAPAQPARPHPSRPPGLRLRRPRRPTSPRRSAVTRPPSR
jgi:hypothetical protein